MKRAAGQWVVLWMIWLLSVTAHAFTYQMMRDKDLLAQSPLIVTGTITDSRLITNSAGYVDATRYTLAVDDVIKGQAGQTIEVEIPGTDKPVEKRLEVFGAPYFDVQDKVVFFLSPKNAQVYQLQQFALGAFEIRHINDALYAVRVLDGVDIGAHHAQGHEHEHDHPARQKSPAYREPSQVRELNGFVNYLKAIQQPTSGGVGDTGTKQVPKQGFSAQQLDNYFVTDPAILDRLTMKQARATYSFLGSRWENGGVYTFKRNGGDAYAGALASGAAAWSISGVTVSVGVSGTTTSTDLTPNDPDNLVLFEDPTNYIGGSYNCSTGGILATAAGYNYGVHIYHSKSYNSALKRFIVVQDGVDCHLSQNNLAQEALSHEVGHSLGLNHDSDSQALMYSYAHDDGRGAQLSCSDKEAISVLYGNNETYCSTGGDGGSGGDGSVGGGDPDGGGGGTTPDPSPGDKPEDHAPSITSNDLYTRYIEAGQSVTLSLTLSDPDTEVSNLVLSATSSDGSVLPASAIAFSGSGAERTLTITAPANGKLGSANLTLKVSDGYYYRTTSIQINVTSYNPPPTITPSSVADQVISKRTSGHPSEVNLSFTIDDDQGTSNLAVMASSDNTLLIPNPNVVLGGSGSQRTVRVVPLTNAVGSANITLRVIDLGNKEATVTFRVTVQDQVVSAKAPTISAIADQVSTVNRSIRADFTVADEDTAVSDLVVTAGSSNRTLIPNANITLTGSTGQRSITVMPANNESGESTITVTVSDGQKQASTAFRVTVEDGMVVRTTAETGSSSLRTRLAQVPAGETITFDPSVFPVDTDITNNAVITLSAPLSATVESTINGDIDGDGIPDVTLQGDTILEAGDVDLQVNGLVFSNARHSAIVLNGTGLLDIQHSAFENNQDTAIRVEAGTLSVSDSLFRNNTGLTGGAIHNQDRALLSRVSFVGNHASQGGAIYTSGAGFTGLTNATLSGNTASIIGAGLALMNGGEASLNNVTITRNDAIYKGDGILVRGGTLSLMNSIVGDNDGQDVVFEQGGNGNFRYSLVQNVTGNYYDGAGNLTGQGPALNDLTYFTPLQAVHTLSAASFAIDTGDANIPGQGGTCETMQQTAKPRPLDGDGDGGAVCDMGAVEYDVMTDGTAQNAEYVRIIQEQYVAFYGRPGDPAGVRYWVGQLARAGGNLSAIQNAFGNSQEFRELIIPGNATTLAELSLQQKAELVNNLYVNMFGRDVEGTYDDPTTGLGYWTSVLDQEGVTLMDIATRIADGAQGEDVMVMQNRRILAQRISQYYSDHGMTYTNEDIATLRALVQSAVRSPGDDPNTVDLSGLGR